MKALPLVTILNPVVNLYFIETGMVNVNELNHVTPLEVVEVSVPGECVVSVIVGFVAIS